MKPNVKVESFRYLLKYVYIEIYKTFNWRVVS